VEFLIFSLEDVTARTVTERRSEVLNMAQALFMTKPTRKEYLDAVVMVVQDWTGCENVGVRVVDDRCEIAYESYVGFSEGFMDLENHIALDRDACICARVVTGFLDAEEAAVKTAYGSFCCNNTRAWMENLPAERRAHYRGHCMACGYQSVAVIPVRYSNDPLGAIHLSDTRPNMVPPDSVEFLESLALLVAEAIRRFNVEEALRKASWYSRSLIEASLDPLVTISPDGEITDVNRATEQLTGVPRFELIGSDFSDYFTDTVLARQGYLRVLAEGQVTDYALTVRHLSGATIDVLYNATVYRNEAGVVQGVFAAARDITERKRAAEKLELYRENLEAQTAELSKVNLALHRQVEEHLRTLEALRRSEARLAEAQRIAHLGSWEWIVASGELRWSDEVFRLLGFAPQSFVPTYARFLEVMDPEDRTRVEEAVALALRQVSGYDCEHRVIRPNGETRIVRDQGEVTFDDSGAPVSMLGTVMDITEQVYAQEQAQMHQQQLLQADKMVSLGILVSGVAHEINNPNHSIMANVGALAEVWQSVQPILDHFEKDFGDFVLGGFEYSESRDKFPEMFSNVLVNSKRIELIVNELRDFARYSPQDKMAAMDVNAVVQSASILVSNLTRKHTEHFVLEYGVHLPPVQGNYQRLEQVVINLVQNACQSLPDRSRSVSVSTSYDAGSDQVRLEVRDEGVGIPAKDLIHLGDPFFTSKRGLGGMGLGLWISFNIVREHGGTLSFTSEEGAGTCAVVVLPAAPGRDSKTEGAEPRKGDA